MNCPERPQAGNKSALSKRHFFCLLIFCAAAVGPFPSPIRARGPKAQPQTSLPRVFSLPAATMVELKQEISEGKLRDSSIERLRERANAALAQEPRSVMDKTVLPPSGDKHDYMSRAPYWWPDPNSPNGLPYIRRDGVSNPEIGQIQDHKNLSNLISETYTLALAYYFLGEEPYAKHASELLQTWFLDPQTRMNPNLEFAQGIPGRNTGRGIGLIETREMYRLVDAIGLLQGSKSWTAEDQKGMEEWCAKFLDWMIHSPHGKDEAAAKNNHGTYYDVQVASLALFTGGRAMARRVLESAGERRIATQIEPDGKQPLELARTKALGYSTMNLAGLFELALLGEDVGVDLWNFHTDDGRSIHKALDYLVPYAAGAKKWPYEQIVEYKVSEFSPLLILAASKFKDSDYEELAVKLDAEALARMDLLPFRWKH